MFSMSSEFPDVWRLSTDVSPRTWEERFIIDKGYNRYLPMDKEAWHQKVLLHPKVTIAQVHGVCIGQGALISESCDISIVAKDAHISHAEQRLGFASSGANLVPLFQHVGYKNACAG